MEPSRRNASPPEQRRQRAVLTPGLAECLSWTGTVLIDLLFENNPSSPDADASHALRFFEHRFETLQGGEAGGDAHRSGRDPMPAAAPRDTP